MERVTVLSGATGFLGREILGRLLSAGDGLVIALVRSKDGRAARERLDTGHARLTVVETDLAAAPHMAGSILSIAAGRPLRIIHGAASVRFDRPLDEARRINLGGTRAMLDLARELHLRGNFERFGYISTAYVAGAVGGVVTEADLDLDAPFRNTYERTKAEAEAAVRAAAPSIPMTIVRPSIIGPPMAAQGGVPKAIAWPIEMFRRNLVSHLPGSPDSLVDLVAVDHVAAALGNLMQRATPTGSCFHLTSAQPITLGEAVDRVAAAFAVRRRSRFVEPQRYWRFVRPVLLATAWGRRRRVVRLGEVLIPYLSVSTTFDSSAARGELAGTGVEFPASAEVLERIVERLQG